MSYGVLLGEVTRTSDAHEGEPKSKGILPQHTHSIVYVSCISILGKAVQTLQHSEDEVLLRIYRGSIFHPPVHEKSHISRQIVSILLNKSLLRRNMQITVQLPPQAHSPRLPSLAHGLGCCRHASTTSVAFLLWSHNVDRGRLSPPKGATRANHQLPWRSQKPLTLESVSSNNGHGWSWLITVAKKYALTYFVPGTNLKRIWPSFLRGWRTNYRLYGVFWQRNLGLFDHTYDPMSHYSITAATR